jgi:hypothetical protein
MNKKAPKRRYIKNSFLASLSNLNFNSSDNDFSLSSGNMCDKKLEDKLNGFFFLPNTTKDGYYATTLGDETMDDVWR